MTDEISRLDRGRMAYDLAHNAEFRRQLKQARYAQQAQTAFEEQTAEREAARKKQIDEREQPRAGSVATGRSRYADTHPQKHEPTQNDDPDPLDDGLDHDRIDKNLVHETERTGQRGMKAGRDRFKKTHDNPAGQYRGSNDERYERD